MPDVVGARTCCWNCLLTTDERVWKWSTCVSVHSGVNKGLVLGVPEGLLSHLVYLK